jgi:glycosyltransferase involved in cell wall biosynthesis
MERVNRMRFVLTRREALDSPDGVNIFIVSLAQALSDLGHEVWVVVGSLRSQAEYRRLLAPRLDLRILALSRSRLTGLASAAAWLRAKWAIDRFKPDLVIHSEAVPLPLRGTIVQVVHDLQPRSGPLAPVWRTIRRFSARRCDYVVATTTELRDELVRDLGMPPRRLVVIPKCVDLQAYRGAGLATRERAILHCGTLPYKDPGATIRAFGALDDPSATLYVTGDMTGPTQEAVEALPDRLRRCVVLLGPADGEIVRTLHCRVRVAAFPTRYAIPVASGTVMEAVAAGTPIVGSSRLSRDVLADGVNGLVVDTNPSAMAAALKAALNDDALWSRLSAGANRMVDSFDAVRVARQYIELASARGLRRSHRLSEDARGSHDAEVPIPRCTSPLIGDSGKARARGFGSD